MFFLLGFGWRCGLLNSFAKHLPGCVNLFNDIEPAITQVVEESRRLKKAQEHNGNQDYRECQEQYIFHFASPHQFIL